MTTDLKITLLSLLSRESEELVSNELAKLEKESPGTTTFDAFEKTVSALLSNPKISVPTQVELNNLSLANTIAKISDGNIPLTEAAFRSPTATTLREFAQTFDTIAIQREIGENSVSLAEKIRTEIFNIQPTATIQGMLEKDKITLPNSSTAVTSDLIKVLSKLPDNFIALHPVSAVNSLAPEALKHVPPERLSAVTDGLKTITRVNAISPTTKTMEHLVNTGFTTSFAVAQTPKQLFVNSIVQDSSGRVSAPVAALVHDTATAVVQRNENMFLNILLKARGTGLKALDGDEMDRKLEIQKQIRHQGLDLNIENLFGSTDQCVCDDCTTVYSAASYFVDLLNYLRNNNLSPIISPNISTAGQRDDIAGTVLEKLFRRRPDLGNLELTCENTNTILPYIDLANEVMESFVVNLESYNTGPVSANTGFPQASIEAFNVTEFQESAELLSQPQAVNHDAYRKLASSVYPFSLPYHLPLASTRAFLEYLKVSRTDLLDAARHKPPAIQPYGAFTVDSMQEKLKHLQRIALDRQVSAEQLGLVQEEYIILTKEAFFTDEWFNVTEHIDPPLSGVDYTQKIGVRNIWEYWGYPDRQSMMNMNDNPVSGFTGLSFVKAQLLPRSGISWIDLTQIVQTSFVNPKFPKGRDKALFEGLRFSYRFLQTLVNNKETDPKRRLGKLAEFLVQAQIINVAEVLWEDSLISISAKTGLMNRTVGGKKAISNSNGEFSVNNDHVREWVFKNFEEMGKIVVLEFGEGPFLSDGQYPTPGALSGKVFVSSDGMKVPVGLNAFPDGSIGLLRSDGRIMGPDGEPFATVTIRGVVVTGDAVSGGKNINEAYPGFQFFVVPQEDGSRSPSMSPIAWVSEGILKVRSRPLDDTGSMKAVEWVLNEHQGSECNIDNVRLQHLDGTALEESEWDKLHRFIRLSIKLGWSIGDVDRALIGLCDSANGTKAFQGSDAGHGEGTNGVVNGIPNGADQDDFLITYDNYTDSNMLNGSFGSPTSKNTDVTTYLIDQLSAIFKILPLVSISVEQLLCLWTDIPTTAVASKSSTTGTKSLYEKLFFTSNLKRNDPIFGPDSNGNYLAASKEKISDHLSVIMAAFRLKADDILFLLGQSLNPFGTSNPTPVQDILSIPNLSQIYRTTLLSRILGIEVFDIPRAIQGFGPAFTSAIAFFDFINWWNIFDKLNFPWTELRYIVDDIKTPHDPLIPSVASVLGTAKTINDGILEIRRKHVIPTDPEKANLECSNEIVKASLSFVFEDETVTKILSLLDGSGSYFATNTPKIPLRADSSGHTFAKKVAAIGTGKLTLMTQKNGTPQLKCRGILTDDEMQIAKELAEEIDTALVNDPEDSAGYGNANGRSRSFRKDKLSQTRAELKSSWLQALDSIASQPKFLFNDIFNGIFDKTVVLAENDVKTKVILAGDIKEDDSDYCPDGRKPSEKRFSFMSHFVPYLQQSLARALVSETVISATGFNDRALAKTILENVHMTKDPDQQTTLDYLLSILKPSSEDPKKFDGYIAVPSNDDYAFIYADDSDAGPFPIILDGTLLSWSIYQEDPKRYWTTNSFKAALKTGTLYPITFNNLNSSALEWKPSSSFRSPVPNSSFTPKIALDRSLQIFDRLKKTAILVNHFPLTSEEVIYIKEHKDDFKGMDFSSLSMEQWKSIQSYVSFRDSLPATTYRLIDLFRWSCQNENANGNGLANQIATATNWKLEDVQAIIARVNFSTGTGMDFKNQEILMRFSKLIALKQKLGIGVPRLFHWSVAVGTSSKDFLKLQDVSDDIKKVTRSKFDLDSWNSVVRPLNDTLRDQQKNALVAFLLVQDEVREQGVIDANSLFEFFLIDVQMTPVVETSRIKQAISTVQIFVQRCFLGLEKDIDPFDLDQKRWDWMSKYRVWEANRKVFLYPENWIDPSLRDDKSPFFQKLEGELMQKDLTKHVVTSAIRSFLYSVNEIANLEITALCVEKLGLPIVSRKTISSTVSTTTVTKTEITNPASSTASTINEARSAIAFFPDVITTKKKIHLFARTTTLPFTYYYISYTQGNWTAWTKMDIEIPYYTSQDDSGKDIGTGSYMSPIAHAGRLLVFIPQIMKKTRANPNQDGQTPETMSKSTSAQLKPQELLEVKMSYTELRDGKWAQRVSCPDGVLVDNTINGNSDTGTSFNGQISNLSFLTAEIVVPDPSFKSNDLSLAIPKVPLGVRVIVSRFDSTGVSTEPPFQAPFKGIGEWTFIDGKLSFYGTGNQKTDTQTDFTLAAPTIFTPKSLRESLTINFENQEGSISGSKLLRSLTATDDRSGEAGPQLDNFDRSPSIIKGGVAIISTVSASTKEIFYNREPDPVSWTSTFKTQLLYHKFIHPLMVQATIPGPDNLPLLPLYAYLSSMNGSNSAPPKSTPTDANATVFDFPLDPNSGAILETKGMITELVPLISDLDEAFGGVVNPIDNTTTGMFNEQSTPFSLYNWELGLHTPMILIDRLLKMQQFDQALNVCHYVFNPMVQGDKSDLRTFWTFAPFRKVATQTTEEMFLHFQANQFRQDVADWRNKPFQPHVVARSRPQAYMMWIVMKYIEILIAYGDFYFRQNTLETIPNAIQMYILASHLYGPRGNKIPRQTPKKKYTYNELATKFDAFSNAMVQLEEAFPFSNQTSLPVGKLPNDGSIPLANVFGFAGTLFFAIPDNPNLRALGDTIDDRLFKLRHSQDINGIFRQLPLFEPPIDPALLVQAAAQGVSISSVLQDLNGPMPNYRFQYLLSKALELAQEVKNFGSVLLSTREKLDFETLSVLRAKHDINTQTVLMELKKLALAEAQKSLEALQHNRMSPSCRLGFYLQQIGADLSGIPAVDKDFMELNARIEKPVDVGGLQLMTSEKMELDQYALSADLTTAVGILETVGAAMNILPTFTVEYMPFGLGGSTSFGGSNLGSYFQAIARAGTNDVNKATYQGGTAGRKAQAMRSLQDRILQANMAGFEIASIDKQVTTQKVRIAMASKEIDIQQSQIDQMHEVDQFLRQKYSNADLYSWMEGATRSLFYDTYTQAYDLAKKAEKAFKFERPALNSTAFIQTGYWDATRDGLLAGEKLYGALKQLEARYIENRGYDYEIIKSVSLRQLDPIQLIKLRTTGSCSFSIPEVLFDMDFPGHYMRRMKSVAVSVPCIVGPYTSINSTLRLTAHKTRFQPTRTSGDGYLEDIDPASGPDDRFTTSNVPINAIAVCTGQNDAGVFELNFHDDRYLPFEGAGVISNWSFSLPQHLDMAFRQFNWESITDVVLTIKYTSIDGGAQMLLGAQTAVKKYLQAVDFTSTAGGLWAIFDLKNEYATGWSRFVADQKATSPTSQTASLDILDINERLPVFASSRPQGSVLAHDIFLITDAAFPGQDVGLFVNGENVGNAVLGSDADVSSQMKIYKLNDSNGVAVGNWKLQLDPSSMGKMMAITKSWLLFRYTLK